MMMMEPSRIMISSLEEEPQAGWDAEIDEFLKVLPKF